MIHKARQYLFNNLLYGENSRHRNLMRHLAGVPVDYRAVMTALVMPDTSKVWLIDVSHWNRPPVNFVRMRDEYNLSGVIVKGCDGSLRSRYSAEHVAGVRAAELPLGLYDWLYPNNRVSINAQTEAWANQAKEYAPEMGIFIDAEWTTYAGVPANPAASDLRAAHDGVRTKYGKPATTYTAKGYADQYLRGFDFNREENWVASYGGTRPLWNYGYIDWQFTGSLDGHRLDANGNAELDGSYFNGSQAEFNQRYGGVGEPPPTGPRRTARVNVYSDGSISEA